MPRIVTHEQSPYAAWIGIGVVIFAAIVVILGALEYLEARASHRHQQNVRDREVLLNKIDHLEAKNAGLREQIAKISRERKIDQEAELQLRRDYGERLAELAKLRKRIAFYESVVSPKDARRGMRVHTFKAHSVGNDVFEYDLILSQVSKDYRVTKGKVDLVVEGVRAGQSEVHSLRELGERGPDPMTYEFKYFQNFSGVLKMPDGFKPRTLVVRLTPEGRKKHSHEFRVPWSENQG
ncbi:MAG: DUF6776 family protein [Gammaproteobacteria bacterium]